MNYLNTGDACTLFEEILNNETYVDKSMLIDKISSKIRTGNKYICITRPRRFGKSVNLHMLGAYYTKGQDCRPLFEGLAVSKTEWYEKHRNCHNVIYIDFSRMPDECADYQSYIAMVQDGIREDMQEAYPKLKNKVYPVVSRMLADSGDSFLFLMDEWDSIFYKEFMTQKDKDAYLGFLKNLLKDQPYVELAYMTGVLPIAKYSSGSELNMFREHNFMNDHTYDVYFGMLEEDVRALCEKQGKISYEELAYWYDGYYLSDGRHLFNPRSVNYALTDGVCLNYWTETGPMNEIADCIEHNTDAVREDIVRMVSGIPVEADLQGYSAADLRLEGRDEILSAMVVYGFLSYHDGYLRIPNHELMEKYQRVLSRESMGGVQKIVLRSKEMMEATQNGDTEKVAAILEEIHDREISFLQYNDENSLSCVITLCYLSARNSYYVEREARSGKGYCDYMFLPKKSGLAAIILELKVDDSCENALAQIREKGYIQKAWEYADAALLVGIGYDKGEKRHRCMIERQNKQG